MQPKRIIMAAVAYAAVIIFVFPAIWMVLTSFMTEREAYQSSPNLFFHPTWAQFGLAWSSGFPVYLSHSILASLISTAVAVVIGVPAAFAMVFHMPGKSSQGMLFFVLSTRFMPFAAIIVPLYIIFLHLHMLDTIPSLLIAYTSMNLPLIIWMARSYFMDLPMEIVEAARMDGCTPFQTLYRVALPVSSSGMVSSALLAIIFSWNDFFFAVNLTSTKSPTLPVMMSSFMTSEGLYLAKVSALGTMIAVVPIVLGLLAQRHIVRGLTAGAVK